MAVNQCLLPASEPAADLARLRAALAPHGRLSEGASGFTLVASLAEATVSLAAGALAVALESPDSARLAEARHALTGLLEELGWSAVWSGDTGEGEPAPAWRAAVVREARFVTPRMRRIVLEGAGLERFAQGGLHLRVLIPADPLAAPVAPELDNGGRLVWPMQRPRPVSRVYTVREIAPDASILTLECALHGGADSPGARWAAAARPGWRVGLTGPGGGVAPEAARLVLAGDETALPAIARILEGLGPTVSARAAIEVEDRAEVQSVATDAPVEWLPRAEGAPGWEARAAALAAAAPDAFVWAAGEASAAARLRAALGGAARSRSRVGVFWRRGEAQKG